MVWTPANSAVTKVEMVRFRGVRTYSAVDGEVALEFVHLMCKRS